MQVQSIKYNYKHPEHKPPFDKPNICYELNAPENEEVMRLVVGKNGKNFYNITETNNIPYIYHSRENNKIIVWCEPEKFNIIKNNLDNLLKWANKIIQNKYEK